MKTANKYAFEKAMRQRGYTLEQLAFCIIEDAGDEITFDETHPNFPSATRRRAIKPLPGRPGLGDYVAAGLSAIGITPERVSAALGVKDCGCKKRQASLNALGRKFGLG